MNSSGVPVIPLTTTHRSPQAAGPLPRTREALLDAQRRWARSREIELDGDGAHTRRVEDNLHRPLSAAATVALAAADGAPMGAALKPGALQRLDSAWSIAVNVFESAGEEDASRLCSLLGFAAQALELEFAARFGPAGSVTSFSHVLAKGDGRPTAVVASYGEAYECGPAPIEASLLEAAPEAWRDLPGTRRLALDLRDNPDRFEVLDAAGLIERVVASNASFGPRGYALQLLWFDAGDARADRMKTEIDRFRIRAGGEVDFRACSWQRLIEGLVHGAAGSETAHVRYLRERYVSEIDPVTRD